MSVLSVLVCGVDATGKTTLGVRLKDTTGRDRRHITIADVVDAKRSTMVLATAALESNVAIIVVDARSGLTDEARNQSCMFLALGLERIVVAINKMDLVGYAREVFTREEQKCKQFADHFGSHRMLCIPISALHRDNIGERASRMAWYSGPTLLDFLSNVQGDNTTESVAERTPAHQFEATIVWAVDRPMLQSRSYLLRVGTATVSATVAPLKYRIDARTLQPLPAKTLDCGDIGVCNLELDQLIDFDPTDARFNLLDADKETVGVVRLHFALRRSQNVQWQALDINKDARAALMGQRPCVVWFTGLSGAGKSTIANLVEKRLHALGRHTYLLDGDNVRHGLNKDLGFTDADRVENIRRVAEVSRLMVDAGLVVLVSFISPFRSERRMARALVADGEFIEVFVDTPLDVAESRDPKGLYVKARRGELKNFTGVDSPYEVPEQPELRLDTTRLTAEDSAQEILRYLERMGIVG